MRKETNTSKFIIYLYYVKILGAYRLYGTLGLCLNYTRKNLTACQEDVVFPVVVDKSGTSCYHPVTRLLRPKD